MRFYFMDVFITTYLEHTLFDKQKKSANYPAFTDKSGDIKKVVIIRRRLM